MTVTAIRGVRVFDGVRLLDGVRSVTLEDGRIRAVIPSEPAEAPDAATVVDGRGATLLPGLIDAHVHVTRRDDLEQLADAGVTTALDMAAWPSSMVDSLRGIAGVTDIRSAGTPATAPGSGHAQIPDFPAAGVVADSAAGRRFVAARVAEHSDYIKVVTDRPGQPSLDLAVVTAIVETAHAAGLLVVAHVVAGPGLETALAAGVDVLTHIPLGEEISTDTVRSVAELGRVAVPTLTMMEGIARNLGLPGSAFEAACATVAALHAAGVRIVAGTDANHQHGVPAAVPHGGSLHHELELLVGCGLTPAEALRTATATAAEAFDLEDRGVIAPGLRADLVLLDGDPTTDIAATRAIRGVWLNGIRRTG